MSAIRVLIADDDPRVRAGLRAFLTTQPDFEVVADAGSTTRVLEFALHTNPCVALVDLLLPKVEDGLTLLRHLTSELGIPVVVMSLRNALAASALNAGATAFVIKDATPDHLLTALRDACNPGDRGLD